MDGRNSFSSIYKVQTTFLNSELDAEGSVFLNRLYTSQQLMQSPLTVYSNARPRRASSQGISFTEEERQRPKIMSTYQPESVRLSWS